MKKFLASLLCVMMVFCMMPAMAFAESAAAPATTLPEAVNGVITLTEDVDFPTAYPVTSDLTVDLAGHKITVKNDTAGDGVFHVTGGTLTINDSVGTGVIDGLGNNNYSIAIWADGGKVIINGGTYTNVGAGTDPHYDLIYTKHGGTVEIYGGTFICQTPNWTLNQKDHQNGAEIAGGAITVYGGNFYQYNPSVSNSENPIANFVASGYTVTADGDYYTVTAPNANAVKTKAELAALVAEGVTSVKLGANIDFDTAFVVEKDLIVDLNGYALTVANDTAGDGVFHVTGGTLTINDSVGTGVIDGLGNNNYSIAIWADGGKVIINGGAYTNVGAGTDTHYDLIYTKHGGTVDIYGGTFICQTPNWTLNQKDHQNGAEIAGGAITVYGGNFYQYNPSVSNTENPIANFVVSGYFASKESASSDYYVVHAHSTCNENHTYCPATCADTCHVALHEVVVTPPAGGGGYVPSKPADNVTNTQTNTGTSGETTVVPTTNANVSGSTTSTKTEAGDVKTETTIDQATADKIVDKAVTNKSEEVIIDTTAGKSTSAAKEETKAAEVVIPTETVENIVEKTEAAITVKTDVAEIKLDSTAAAAVADQAEGESVSIVVEKVAEVTAEEEQADGTAEEVVEVHFELKVVSDGKVISDFNGGNVSVTVAVPAAMATKKVVCVYIDEQGLIHRVPGEMNANGTYTFTTTHFSTYALMTAEEAEAAIEEQKAEINAIKFKTRSQITTLKGKKAVKISWKVEDGMKFDGFEVYRSTKKYSGFGKKPFYVSKSNYYVNNKNLKKGNTYYYKVRGFVYINDEKVYTDWSTKAWRTIK